MTGLKVIDGTPSEISKYIRDRKKKEEMLEKLRKERKKKEIVDDVKIDLQEDVDDISPCPKCYCMTKSIRISRANYQCGKCKADKTLSDVFYYEALVRNKMWRRK